MLHYPPKVKKLKEDVEISLGLLGIDKALKDEESPKPIANSSDEKKAKYEKWERANSLSLKIIRRSISESPNDVVPKTENAKECFDEIKLKYKESDKAETRELMDKLMGI
ncbi:hypothetical protein QYF36_010828 [Acer negundo]|nr:hypothetical protein QYF36_010828 [Acer negundo]